MVLHYVPNPQVLIDNPVVRPDDAERESLRTLLTLPRYLDFVSNQSSSCLGAVLSSRLLTAQPALQSSPLFLGLAVELSNGFMMSSAIGVEVF